MRLRDVQHQSKALSLLQRALRNNRFAHAFLFEGPEGVGKELAATALAARLLCAQPDTENDACGACEACRMLATGSHPDFHRVHRGLSKQHPDPRIRRTTGLYLTTDIVRHFLIAPAALTPWAGARRVFVIADAERMTDDAQNALLKTLEEPPGRAVLILVTTAASRLLPTIRSRCQRVTFQALPAEFVQHVLTHRHAVGSGTATILSGLCGGRVGAALRWYRVGLQDELPVLAGLIDLAHRGQFDGFSDALIARVKHLARNLIAADQGEPRISAEADDESDEALEGSEVPDETGDTAGKGEKLGTDVQREAARLLLMLTAAFLRDAMLLTEGADPRLLLLGHSRLSEQLARTNDADWLVETIGEVARCEQMLDANVNQKMIWDRLCVVLRRGLLSGSG